MVNTSPASRETARDRGRKAPAVLLIYPQLGSWDDVLRDIPLSLIYAATDTVKAGFEVRILDFRLVGDKWRREIDNCLDGNPGTLVGLSVMTGKPILNALEISRYVKSRFGNPVVWGGPHVTILPEQTLENPAIDFIIRDWGSRALCGLVKHLAGDPVPRSEILGLGYRENGQVVLSPPQEQFEVLDWRDLPYHLVEISGSRYNRLQNGELVFPIYSSMGCPYNCNFCMAPAVYRKIRGKKWVASDAEDVLDHIGWLAEHYEFSRIQFYDDDTFVDLDRAATLLRGYVARGYHRRFKIDFRGARINELDRMDDSLLSLMETAGVELLAIGVESGSDRTLQAMNKQITVEQILRVNSKLARYLKLKPHYNFFCGIPGETEEDLIRTKELLIRLVEDHPGCYLGRGAHWKPIPGSALYKTAVRDYGLRSPNSLEEWAAVDSSDADRIVHPWYTPRLVRMIGLLQVAGLVLDSKTRDMTGNMGPALGPIFRLLVALYRPLLRLRLKYNSTFLMCEHRIWEIGLSNLGRLMRWGRRIRILGSRG